MLKNILSSFILLLLISSAGCISTLFAQEDLVMDSLVTGSRYRVTLYNEMEVIGKVAKQDSLFAYILTETGTVRVRKEDIFSISKTTIPRLVKALVTLGGGILLQGSDYHYGNNDKPGYSLQLTAAYPFTDNKAIRLDVGFGQVKMNPVIYAYYSGNESVVYDQTRSVFNINANFIFGNFETNPGFSVYGLGGLGVILTNESSYDYSYYQQYDSAWHSVHQEGLSATNLNIALGGGFRFDINKKLGVYTEIQYNITTFEGFFFWAYGKGYFPIRAGLTYSFY